MKSELTPFEGLHIIHPSVFTDERGYFFESFNMNKFRDLTNFKGEFVQDNQSLSHKNVVRGLHFQVPPFTQAKLVRVVRGAIIDFVVDLRKNSPTFGKYFSLELNEKNNISLFIPEGFAHGFTSLTNDTIFLYKCSHYYHKESERTLLWNDPDLNIDWRCDKPIISEKDNIGFNLKQFNSPF